MAKPYLTSTELIEDVKRTVSVPISQNTFSEDDILAFANKEMFLAQVPSILQYHEEFLVYSLVIPLEQGKVRYPIPNRAIGMKLRDLNYKDSNGNIYEMSKINPDDKTYFQRFAGGHTVTRHYYLENNSIVLTPFNEGGDVPQGSLEATYYLRPNSLVTNDKAAICTAFSKTVTVDNADLVAGDVLVIGSNNVIAGTDFAIGATSQATAANLSNYLNTLTGITATVALAIVNVQYKLLSTTISSESDGLSVQTTQTVVFDQVPTNITNESLIDFLQTLGGHATYSYDILIGENAVSLNTVTFSAGVVPADFKVGDYICSAYECIIPQIPDDLHNLLVERTCSRILASLGDTQGLKDSKEKINELEARQSTIIDNRVEGSPQKVLNRHSLLRYGKNRSIRGRL